MFRRDVEAQVATEQSVQPVPGPDDLPVGPIGQCTYRMAGEPVCERQAIGTYGLCGLHNRLFAADLETFRIVASHFQQDLVLFWTRSNFYLVVQAGLLSVFVTTAGRESRLQFLVETGLAVSGLMLAAFWFLVTRGSIYWIRQWRRQMISLDERLDRHGHIREVEGAVTRTPLMSPSYVTQFVPLLFFGVWMALTAILVMTP